MSFMKPRHLLQASLLLIATFALAACGFHLRENVTLPPQMQRVHLNVKGSNAFERQLAHALTNSGVTVEDDSGPGIAELNIPVAAFSTDTLSAGGYVRISEYAVRYKVEFDVRDSAGQILVPHQHIDMQHEYSYDATDTIGNASQVQEIENSLSDDMVQAILFRLQAAGKHGLVAPAATSSTH